MRSGSIGAAAVALSLLTGCATQLSMGPGKSSGAPLELSPNSLVLMSITLRRSESSRYIPKPGELELTRQLPNGKAENIAFSLSESSDAIEVDQQATYFARMPLPPGKYTLQQITGTAGAFPFFGRFEMPVMTPFTVNPTTVLYIGRVQGLLRPSVGNEFPAGPPLPVIDQAATGMSTGTWDITLGDYSHEDLALFRKHFPALHNANITTDAMPNFDRAGYQRMIDERDAQMRRSPNRWP